MDGRGPRVQRRVFPYRPALDHVSKQFEIAADVGIVRVLAGRGEQVFARAFAISLEQIVIAEVVEDFRVWPARLMALL